MTKERHKIKKYSEKIIKERKNMNARNFIKERKKKDYKKIIKERKTGYKKIRNERKSMK